MDILLSYNEREHITNLLNKTNRSNLELEIRLGYFQEHFFKSTGHFKTLKVLPKKF